MGNGGHVRATYTLSAGLGHCQGMVSYTSAHGMIRCRFSLLYLAFSVGLHHAIGYSLYF